MTDDELLEREAKRLIKCIAASKDVLDNIEPRRVPAGLDKARQLHLSAFRKFVGAEQLLEQSPEHPAAVWAQLVGVALRVGFARGLVYQHVARRPSATRLSREIEAKEIELAKMARAPTALVADLGTTSNRTEAAVRKAIKRRRAAMRKKS